MRWLSGALVIGLWMTAVVRPAAAQRVTALQKLDQTRFTGTWFEIARYPYKREKVCVRNVQLLVALADRPNQLQFVNSCEDKKGYTNVRSSTAKGPKPKVNKDVATAEFKVAEAFPFSTKIWVLGLAPDNSWAILGSPNHKHLWIFSKTTALEPGKLRYIESQAQMQGYDPGLLSPVGR